MTLAEERARELLRDGDVDVLGRMPWSSNATFLVNLSAGDDEMLAIYKPQRGERPLWDFPRGTLCHREVAAFEVSHALGWDIVPDTVFRDGPAGLGMMQRFVEHDPEEHYFTLLEEHADAFRRMAVFDVVINNTDRKGGHCLRALDDGRIFGIDHGVSFHTQWKLRTVIWEFGGESIPADVCSDLHKFAARLKSGAGLEHLSETLDRFELDAIRARTEHLLATGALPEADDDYHCYPWPMI
ncbi:MAG TPA: SCO1664 family protein [Acidimicrobiia bacterium]|nr:SCO1664 family protein [Acidimicrobiia bacterium]